MAMAIATTDLTTKSQPSIPYMLRKLKDQWMKRQPWSWRRYTQQLQNRYQQQVLCPKSILTPMVNPWVHDTLVRKSYKWRLREACELGAKHSRGVQTDAAEDALWSQWGAANPKKTEALRRRRWREPSREPSSPKLRPTSDNYWIVLETKQRSNYGRCR